ncbi:MAG: MoaF N-terminal domain-containing protein [Colwellia sp.]|nr:MoaF N-terminal domain-containing protein [Colwellia sp.]
MANKTCNDRLRLDNQIEYTDMNIFKTFLILISFIPLVAFAGELTKETRKLDGVNITYKYTSGRSYSVKFEAKGISYRYLTGSKPNKWWGPFPYTAFEVQPNQYFASWFEKGYGDYVTLLINFDDSLLYGSAIIAGEEVHFHGANIIKVQGK